VRLNRVIYSDVQGVVGTEPEQTL